MALDNHDVERISERVTYQGVFRVGSKKFLAFSAVEDHHHHGAAVEIKKAADLMRLENEFQIGEEIEIEIETLTDWSSDDLQTTLIGFSKTHHR
jgi:hypothetical protein